MQDNQKYQLVKRTLPQKILPFGWSSSSRWKDLKRRFFGNLLLLARSSSILSILRLIVHRSFKDLHWEIVRIFSILKMRENDTITYDANVVIVKNIDKTHHNKKDKGQICFCAFYLVWHDVRIVEFGRHVFVISKECLLSYVL